MTGSTLANLRINLSLRDLSSAPNKIPQNVMPRRATIATPSIPFSEPAVTKIPATKAVDTIVTVYATLKSVCKLSFLYSFFSEEENSTIYLPRILPDMRPSVAIPTKISMMVSSDIESDLSLNSKSLCPEDVIAASRSSVASKWSGRALIVKVSGGRGYDALCSQLKKARRSRALQNDQGDTWMMGEIFSFKILAHVRKRTPSHLLGSGRINHDVERCID